MITLKKSDDGRRHFELGDVCLNQEIRTFRGGFEILKQSFEKGEVNDRQALVGLRLLREARLDLDREEAKSRLQSRRRGRSVSIAESAGGFVFLCNGKPLESNGSFTTQFSDVKSGVALALQLSKQKVFTDGERNQALGVLDLEHTMLKFERLLRKSFEAAHPPATAAGGT